MLENDGMALRTEKFRFMKNTIVGFHPERASWRFSDESPAILDPLLDIWKQIQQQKSFEQPQRPTDGRFWSGLLRGLAPMTCRKSIWTFVPWIRLTLANRCWILDFKLRYSIMTSEHQETDLKHLYTLIYPKNRNSLWSQNENFRPGVPCPQLRP